jgi:ADP-heptose:LPS heptosyltransferase
LRQEDFSFLHTIEEVRDLREYVCVHPGASVRGRCWSPEKFAVVADALAARGFQVVLTGTAVEAELTQAVRKVMRTSAIDLAGRTSLGALAALLSNASLLVCNDTGVSHLAAALRVKSVVIFSASSPQRWAPLDRDRHRILVSDQWSVEQHGITPAAVMAQVEDLLSKEVKHLCDHYVS